MGTTHVMSILFCADSEKVLFERAKSEKHQQKAVDSVSAKHSSWDQGEYKSWIASIMPADFFQEDRLTSVKYPCLIASGTLVLIDSAQKQSFHLTFRLTNPNFLYRLLILEEQDVFQSQ